MSKPVDLSQSSVEFENNSNAILEEDAGAFIHFATVAEQIGATTKRLEKAALIGSYFTSLSDNNLVLAALYFAGYIFPLRDRRRINIGGAALLSAISAVTGEEKTSLQEKLVKLGDPGDVTARSFSHNPRFEGLQPILTLAELLHMLEHLFVLLVLRNKSAQLLNV